MAVTICHRGVHDLVIVDTGNIPASYRPDVMDVHRHYEMEALSIDFGTSLVGTESFCRVGRHYGCKL